MIPSSDSYFSVQKGLSRTHQEDDGTSLLSSGYVGPSNFSPYTPSSLDSKELSVDSVKRPSSAPPRIAIQNQTRDVLTPPQSPTSNANNEMPRFCLPFGGLGNRSPGPRSPDNNGQAYGSEHDRPQEIGTPRLSDPVTRLPYQVRESLQFSPWYNNQQTRFPYHPGNHETWHRDESLQFITEHQQKHLAPVKYRKMDPAEHDSGGRQLIIEHHDQQSLPLNQLNLDRAKHDGEGAQVITEQYDQQRASSIQPFVVDRARHNSETSQLNLEYHEYQQALADSQSIPQERHKSEDLEFITVHHDLSTTTSARATVDQDWHDDNKVSGNHQGFLARFNRRLGMSEGHRSQPNDSIPLVPPRATTHQRGQTHNVHQPVYNLQALQQPEKAYDSEHGKPRGRARLQSLFKRTVNHDNDAATAAAAQAGFHLDIHGANLSFLPSEAQKIATPPASAEPRLNPFLSSPRAHSPRGLPGASRSPASRDSSSSINSMTTHPQPRISDDIFRSRWGNTTDGAKGLSSVNVVSIPEHLLTSPLCPRHPKHKSGGNGVCPYHG